MLCLDIAWLTGTAFLARDPSDPAPDWPPQPDRIFSALVASWGLGGEDSNERDALEWLEEQKPPRLHLPEPAHPRQPVTVYVPANDVRGPNPDKPNPTWFIKLAENRPLTEKDKKDFKRALGTAVLGSRVRNDRSFPAVVLDPGARVHLSLVWDAVVPAEHRPRLDALAQRISYVGHSASLVRAMFREIDATPEGLQPARRAPYRGRLRQLEDLHHRHMRGDTNARPRPAMRRRTPPVASSIPRHFATDPTQWFVFEHAGGDRPDLRSAAPLAEAMRQAMMEAWTSAHGEAAPAWISGHEADGSPVGDPHLAAVPLANVGWKHSDGRLMGLALVPPASEISAWAASGPEAFARRQAFRQALARLGETDGEGRSILTLAPPGGGSWRWRLAPAASGLRSLDPARYVRPSRLWGSATPVLLDRHVKSAGPPERSTEAGDMVRAACVRAGLPEPVAVSLTKHAAISGVPSARPAGGSPRWAGWARRKSFGARAFVHVRLAFDETVAGPLLLGAGRFHGLGLFLPMREGGQ